MQCVNCLFKLHAVCRLIVQVAKRSMLYNTAVCRLLQVAKRDMTVHVI